MHFVYILYSARSDIYYVGESNDVSVRMKYHNQLNKGGFTSKHRPWTVKRILKFEDRGTAIKVERYIKRRKSRLYIISLIEDEEVCQKLIDQFKAG